MSEMSKVADAMRQCGIEDMERIAAMLYQLTDEEHAALAQSPVCLNCNHREILHNHDFEEGTRCNVCGCTDQILEGDFSYWSAKNAEARKRMAKYNDDPVNVHIRERMNALVTKFLHLDRETHA